MKPLKYTVHQGLAPTFQSSTPGDSGLDQFSESNNPHEGNRHREQNPIVTADSRSGGGYYSNYRFRELDSSNVQTNAYPIDRVLEILAGVIMVLTFTSVLSVSHAGKADVHAMLIGSLGRNLARGIIDG